MGRLNPIEIPDFDRSLLNRGERIFARAAGTGFEVRDAGALPVLDLFGEIGLDLIDTKTVGARLSALNGRDVDIHINSPGGDMFEGIGIYNLLAQYPGKVTVKIFALAASAASTIAMAGDEIQIGNGAFVMIHNCWAMAMGNQFKFREVADYLAPFDSGLTDIYVARTGEKRDQIESWMKGEKWFSAQEAIDNGFADSVIEAGSVAQANFGLEAVYRNVPAALQGQAKRTTKRVEGPLQLEKLLQEGGLSSRAARMVAKAGWAELNKNEAGDAIELEQINQLAARVAETNAALRNLRQ